MCVSLCVFNGFTQKNGHCEANRHLVTFLSVGIRCGWEVLSRGRELTSLLWTWDRDWTLDSGGMTASGVKGARGGHVGKGINSQGWKDKKTNIAREGDDILYWDRRSIRSYDRRWIDVAFLCLRKLPHINDGSWRFIHSTLNSSNREPKGTSGDVFFLQLWHFVSWIWFIPSIGDYFLWILIIFWCPRYLIVPL